MESMEQVIAEGTKKLSAFGQFGNGPLNRTQRNQVIVPASDAHKPEDETRALFEEVFKHYFGGRDGVRHLVDAAANISGMTVTGSSVDDGSGMGFIALASHSEELAAQVLAVVGELTIQRLERACEASDSTYSPPVFMFNFEGTAKIVIIRWWKDGAENILPALGDAFKVAKQMVGGSPAQTDAASI